MTESLQLRNYEDWKHCITELCRMADRILLTKTDLVSDEQRAALDQRLRVLNPAAPIVPVVNGAVDPAWLFDAGL